MEFLYLWPSGSGSPLHLQTWWFGALLELSGVTHPPQRLHHLPQLSMHFPQFLVLVFHFYPTSVHVIIFCSCFPLLTWSGANPRALSLRVMMYFMMSSFSLFWETSGTCHPRDHSLPGPLGFMLFPVSFGAFSAIQLGFF